VKLAFVVSTGRCGSTMLSQILHQHPGVLSVNEFFTSLRIPALFGGAQDYSYFPDGEMDGRELWQLVGAPAPVIDMVVRDGLQLPEMRYPYGRGRFDPVAGIPLLCHFVLPALTDDPDRLFDKLAAEVPAWPRRPAAHQYSALFASLADALGRQVIVERSGGSLYKVRQLRRAFPEARFVHMYRSGPDTALSLSRYLPARILAVIAIAAAEAKLPRRSAPEAIEAALPLFKGMVAPPYDVERIMAYPIPLEVFGRTWSGMTCTGLIALQQLPAGMRASIRYEDLLGPGLEPALTRLAEFIGVTAPAQWLDSARSMVDRSRGGSASAQLDSDTLAALRATCDRGEQAIAAMVGRPAQGNVAPPGESQLSDREAR
jgi:hypothetical protein